MPKPSKKNLLAAAEGKKLEWCTLYPGFAKVAEEEGFAKVAEAPKEYPACKHPQSYYEVLAENW